MSRVFTWALLCAMLCGLAGTAMAQQIFVGGDPATMKMDVYLRDADLPEVLTALFNSTDGKYQLKLGEGVVGRISRLQLTATPFEEALDAILGTEYSYTKKKNDNGTALYTITGRNAGAGRPTGGMVMNAPPADDPITPSATNLGAGAPTKSTGSGFPSLTYFTKPTTGAASTTATGTPGAPGTTTTEAATEELSVVKMIGINYLDLESICDALGGSSIALFDQGNYGGGTGGSSGGGGSRSSRNNRNNDNYNDNYNNNNNNNDNNTRTNRTNRNDNNSTNTRNTRTSNRNNDY